MMGAVLLSDASELLLFDHAASDTTDHLVGLVAQFAESGWLNCCQAFTNLASCRKPLKGHLSGGKAGE